MSALAAHILGVPESGIRRIHELAAGLDGVIMLAVGEPDVAVAPHILAAGSEAWLRDDTDYTPNEGIDELRAAFAEQLERDHGLIVAPERICATNGGTQAVLLALQLVLDARDEVLVPDPGYTTFTMVPRLLEAEPVPYRLDVEHGFLPQPAQLEALVTPRTRAIIINSPSNPLGRVFPPQVLANLLDFARAHDLWVISDEVYEAFTWSAPHTPTAVFDTEERVLTVLSLSKRYALTGARIGAVIVPSGLASRLRAVQEATIGCLNPAAQWAGVAALTGDQACVAEAAEHYRGNLDAGAALLAERGIRFLAPDGAFYLWVDVSHLSGDDVAEWAARFLIEQRVAVAPGSAFGASGEGWIRLCAAAEREQLLEGIRRIPAP